VTRPRPARTPRSRPKGTRAADALRRGLPRGHSGGTAASLRSDPPLGPAARHPWNVAVPGPVVGLLHLAAGAIAGYGAFLLALDLTIPAEAAATVTATIAGLLTLKVAIYFALRLHPRHRHPFPDRRGLTMAAGLGAVVATLVLFVADGGRTVPLVVPLLDGMLTTVLVLGFGGVARYVRRRSTA
jgi:hypothetical protein